MSSSKIDSLPWFATDGFVRLVVEECAYNWAGRVPVLVSFFRGAY